MPQAWGAETVPRTLESSKRADAAPDETPSVVRLKEVADLAAARLARAPRKDDDKLAGTGYRIGHLAQVQYLRTAMLLEQHRFHRASPLYTDLQLTHKSSLRQ